MTMTLRNGKFYRDGQVVPLEFGNKEQIAIKDKLDSLRGDGVAVGTIFYCVCGGIFDVRARKRFKCDCGLRYMKDTSFARGILISVVKLQS